MRRGKYKSDDYIVCDFEERFWTTFLETGIYSPDSLHSEGFIHCAYPHQVCYVMDKYFKADSYRILVFKKSELSEHLKFEGVNATNLYPHLYRPVLKSDVLDSWNIQRNEQGSFDLPEEFIA